MRGRWELSDAQWERIEPMLRPKRRSDGRGRPWQDTRAVLNGILWVLGTGAQWRELPKKYPPYQTCHRRFQRWVREGKLKEILRVLAAELQARGKLELEEGFSIQSASPHESQLVEEVLGQSFLDELPERLIGDAAYDSDPLDDYLLETYDIELIAPHKCNRKRLTQDGRPFRRYRRRWCVERLFAWLHWFRRLVIRWEYHAENFLGMVQLGCIKIMLRHI